MNIPRNSYACNMGRSMRYWDRTFVPPFYTSAEYGSRGLECVQHACLYGGLCLRNIQLHWRKFDVRKLSSNYDPFIKYMYVCQIRKTSYWRSHVCRCRSHWCPGPGPWAGGWWGRGRSPDHQYHHYLYDEDHHHHYLYHHNDDGHDLVHCGHQEPEEEHQPALGGAAPISRHRLPRLGDSYLLYLEVILQTSTILTGDRDCV